MRSSFSIYTNGFVIWSVYIEDNNIILETLNTALSIKQEQLKDWLLHNNMELVGYL